MLTLWLKQAIDSFARLFPEGSFFAYSFNIKSMIAVVLVSLICGAVGSLVVGNRMAFFSDALAHCAFAGVTLGLLMGVAIEARREGLFVEFGIPGIMVGFGILVGFGIAFVKETTALSSDTVIGVFFAAAMGFGGLLFKTLSKRSSLKPESFLFGDLLTVMESDLLLLFLLAVITAAMLLLMFNQVVFASFNASLARSRDIQLRLCNYAFIVLLALIVNLCLKIVGVLLINALLIVPAATAANLSRNMRQMFWMTIGLSVFAGLAGQVLSWEVPKAFEFEVGLGGVIVIVIVLLFFLSMAFGPLILRRQAGQSASNPVPGK